MQTTTMPQVHITNYQQYIDADYLIANVISSLPADQILPEHVYASIAYMQIVKSIGGFTTTLVLSIKGKSYRFKLTHNNTRLYLAQYGLDLNTYADSATKAKDIHQLNVAFEAVVEKNIKQITKAIVTAYAS